MAHKYERADAIADTHGCVIEVGNFGPLVILNSFGSSEIILGAEQRDAFAKAYALAEHRAEVHAGRHAGRRDGHGEADGRG